jgi:AcrR family transcriptional regulator
MAAAAQAITAAVEKSEGKLPPKKRQLVGAAVRCFSENGYAATSTRMIAQQAGVAEATIFRHFGTKQQLLLRLVAPVLDQLIMPAIELEARQLFADIDDLPRFLTQVMHSRLAFADKYAPLVRIVMQELPVNAALRQLFSSELGQPVFAMACREITRLADAGDIRPVDPARIVRMIASLLIGYFVTRTMILPGDWDDDAEVQAMVDIICHGLLTR